ncbi:ribonuclease HI family protein [Bdellovibrionota bacterium]
MTEIDTLCIYSDGASRGNPGEGGAGVVIRDQSGRELSSLQRYLGLVTNNVAEYQALLLGLKEAQNLQARHLKLFLDSELVVKQVRGEYKVKNHGLLPLYELAMEALEKFDSFEINYIPREENHEADALANAAIDERTA